MRPLLLALLLLTLPAPAQQPPTPDRPFPLLVGDPAPPLPVQWFRPGPAWKIENGRPYVVEFWSTWCGPCIRQFPHLSALQSKYKDRLTILAVSVWEPRPHEVGPFIEKQGDRMSFAVGLDSCPPAPPDADNPSDWAKDNGQCSLTWLRASGADGIPAAFIVDAGGRIVWTGHSRDIDEPLAAVMEGRWDLASYLPIYKRRRAAHQAGDHDAYLRATDELIALGPSMAWYAAPKFEHLLTQRHDPDRAYAFAREAIDTIARDNYDALNEIASIILRTEPRPPSALDLALAAALRAQSLTRSSNPDILATLAAVHAARADFRKAAESQRAAVACAIDDEKPALQKQLDDYLARAASPTPDRK